MRACAKPPVRLGVTTLHERVADFAILDEQNPRTRRILGLRTAQGTFVRASWFIDASGGDASLLGSASISDLSRMGRARSPSGRTCQLEEWVEGTTLYMISPPGEYMEWIWEIPIRPGISSIGYIAPGSSVKTQRGAGLRTQDILDTASAALSRVCKKSLIGLWCTKSQRRHFFVALTKGYAERTGSSLAKLPLSRTPSQETV